MKDALELIRGRRSCRTFEPGPLDPITRRAAERLVSARNRGPFGSALRFRLLDQGESGGGARRGGGRRGRAAAASGRRLGTYGVVRGAPCFLAGALKRGPMDREDYGWIMEELVLELTALGLGTCWTGGTFDRSSFASAMDLDDDETIPAVTPVGFPAGRSSAVDALFHIGAGSERRRSWRSLFFVGDLESPLSPSGAGAWVKCLEAVRLAPSSWNAQPWRIVKERGNDRFCLLLAGPVAEGSMRRLDAGIAMCHFALVAGELGLPGGWVPAKPCRKAAGAGLVEIATWKAV